MWQTKVLVYTNAQRRKRPVKTALICAVATLLSTGAFAQSGVVEITAVTLEPGSLARIHTYITEHRLHPVKTPERIGPGFPVPRDVELEAVPEDWGRSLTKYRYAYSDDRVMLVDPMSRKVVMELR